MKEHELKCWPEYFDAVVDGRKPFEVRRDDGRGFCVGDVLRLREWVPARADIIVGVDIETGDFLRLPHHVRDRGGYTGREHRARVTYVLRDFDGIDDGMVVMGLASP